ncbi:OmpH family outer membrane protein [Palleronia sediminis]|uniref:OmpH family outer membrane protein n=1 Tax=Palleronia sediminis TaxID=2547833 RepID=A0A4R6AJ84_9RHOB|nr:OmpH family outer membrane protein [Palleronia sediminis]TDL83557.1 OmpH family outer membrane protein [Palleronia sediminis]
MSRSRLPSRRTAILGAVVSLALWAAPAAGQSFGQGVNPVVVVDQERLFQESAFGAAALDEIERQSEALAAENRRIEAELTEDERDLTEQRATLPMDEFRAKANAFDQRVQRLRDEQDVKTAALTRLRDAARQGFFRQAAPVLSDLMAELGATVLLDSREVLAVAGGGDITDLAIARVDAAIPPMPAPQGDDDPVPGDDGPEGNADRP